MTRPKNPDRDTVADKTLTVRFTTPEMDRLGVLVAKRLAELRGTGASVNAGGLVRALVVRELDALGIEAPTATSKDTAQTAQPTLPGLDATPVPTPPPPPQATTRATPSSSPASTSAAAPPRGSTRKPVATKPAKPTKSTPKKKPRR